MRTVFDNCWLVRMTSSPLDFSCKGFISQTLNVPASLCCLEWKGSPSSPVSSLFNTDTFLICCRQEQFDTGDSLALLFNALCLRHKTESFQTVVTLWGTFTHFPPGKAKTYFSVVSQKCWWVSEAWQAAYEAGFPCSIFHLHLIWSGFSREERRGRASLSDLQPSLCRSEIREKGDENPSGNVIGLMLVGLKPANHKNCKPSQRAAFQDHKKYKSWLKQKTGPPAFTGFYKSFLPPTQKKHSWCISFGERGKRFLESTTMVMSLSLTAWLNCSARTVASVPQKATAIFQ